jgi:hypothetical protein
MRATISPWVLTVLLASTGGCGDDATGGPDDGAADDAAGEDAGTDADGDAGGDGDGDATDAEPDGAPEDDAELVSASLPASLACAAPFAASVTLRNTGTTTWTRAAGYKLGMLDDTDPFYAADTRIWLPEGTSVAPGGSWTFEFALTAPGTAGSYVTDWQMVREGLRWFGDVAQATVEVTCDAPLRRTGRVRLAGNSLQDDTGTFNALGTTMMWAAWAYKFDRAKLERNLAAIAGAGFHYIRALGVVGDYDDPDYWDGREIDWRWPDYDDVIAGLTDLAYDDYGLRLEWTLIGDGQLNIPNEADRYALLDRFLAMSVGREQKIIHFELANEAWQNGFEGAAGIDQLRALTRYMRDRTEILVAASAPAGVTCEDYELVYGGDVADIATIHFDRNIALADGPWRPVRQPWELEYCTDVPVGSNNEPIGPGASVASENEPIRLVAAAITTYVANLPFYVYHTSAGVRGDTEIYDMAGFDAFRQLHELVPGDLASWTRQNAHWAEAPFVVFAGDAGGTLHPDTMWPDLADPTSGCVRAYAGVSGDRFFVHPIGILGNVTMEPRRAMRFEVFEPLGGARLSEQTRAAGERFELSGAEALVIRGTYL